jgi:hypothetical protein
MEKISKSSLLPAIVLLTVLAHPACRKPVGPSPPLNRSNLCPTTNGNNNCTTPPGASVATGALTGGAGAAGAAMASISAATALVGRGSSSLSTEKGEVASSEYAAGRAQGVAEETKAPAATGAGNTSSQSNALAERGGGRQSQGSGSSSPSTSSLRMSGDGVKTEANTASNSVSDSAIKSFREDESGAGASAGGGKGSTGREDDGGLGDAFSSLFGSEGGSGGDAAAKASISFLSNSGEVSPMGTPDPVDYFVRFNSKLSLFEVVSSRYMRTQLRWPLEDAQRTLTNLRDQSLKAPPAKTAVRVPAHAPSRAPASR